MVAIQIYNLELTKFQKLRIKIEKRLDKLAKRLRK